MSAPCGRRRMALFIPPRESGEGGSRIARWDGRGLDDDSVDADQAQSPTPPPPHGACHRAGHFGPDPLVWSSSPAIAGAENKFVLAARLRPSSASQQSRNETTLLDSPPEQQGGGAPKGAHPLAASLQTGLRRVRNRLLKRQRLLREPLAFRRSAAALAGASERSSSAQAALHATKRMQALPAPSIALKPGTWRPGHNAGRVDARTARERVTSPPAGTALAPSNGCHR